MKLRYLSVILFLFFGGCSSKTINPKLQDIGDHYSCKTDCKKEWEMAHVWVMNHAVTPVSVANDTIIQTKVQPNIISFGINKVGNMIKMNMQSTNPFTLSTGTFDEVPKSFYYFLKTGEDIYKPPFLATGIR